MDAEIMTAKLLVCQTCGEFSAPLSCARCLDLGTRIRDDRGKCPLRKWPRPASRFDPRPTILRLANALRRGIIGITKVILRRDRTPADERRYRRATCRRCTRSRLGLFCASCWCLLPAKTRVNSESCPIRKWGRIQPCGGCGSDTVAPVQINRQEVQA